MLRVMILHIVMSAPLLATAQTCCSGGVPVSSHLGFAAQDGGTFRIGVAGDVIVLRTLFTGDEQIAESGRKRVTQSLLLRLAYNPADRITIEALIPYVRQQRTIDLNGGPPSMDVTRGLGDAAFLVTGDIIDGPVILRAGAGLRLPLGAYDRRNAFGAFYVEDLQPGSGSWDGLFLGSIVTTPGWRPSATIYLRSIYRLSGTNRDARNGSQSYQFGNDLQVLAGLNDEYLALGQLWASGVGLRYRTAQRDAIGGFENTGTGGKFLFAKVDHGIAFGAHQIGVYLELPVYRKVNETQLAPSAAFGIGWYTRIIPKSGNGLNRVQ